MLFPEFDIAGGVAARSETVARTLFNPTRRPAPAAGQASANSGLKRGQFALTGTLLVEGKNTAFLREIAGNKARRVQAGETINGMKVADVKADRVILTLGDESEELVLKVATNPRPTPQPVAVAAPPGAAAAAAAAARPAPAAVTPQAPSTAAAAPSGAPQTALERRRAARAASIAAAAAARQSGAADAGTGSQPGAATRRGPGSAPSTMAPAN
jgi:hypothetical protein